MHIDTRFDTFDDRFGSVEMHLRDLTSSHELLLGQTQVHDLDQRIMEIFASDHIDSDRNGDGGGDAPAS
ncbi:hypothetical protein U1Q18_024788 [Sarracenia purpurea var. burkii]